MNWITKIVVGLLTWLSNLAKTDVTSNDAMPQPDVRKDLNDRINASDPRLRD